MTTQNLLVKKNGGMVECFNCCCDRLFGFEILEESRNQVSNQKFADELCYIISSVSKVKKRKSAAE